MAARPEPVKYTPNHIDGLVRAATKHRHITQRHEEESQRMVAQQQNADRAAMIANVEHEGFCVKCRDKKTVVTAGEATHKNGMKSIHGECPDCGTNVHRFIPKEKPSDGST
jgi:hypothetical protein